MSWAGFFSVLILTPIPRTMWTDIDYMDRRRIFTLDPQRFPIERMQTLVKYLHDRQQHYIVMVDPAVAEYDYAAYDKGQEMNVFMKQNASSNFRGVVWPVRPAKAFRNGASLTF